MIPFMVEPGVMSCSEEPEPTASLEDWAMTFWMAEPMTTRWTGETGAM